MPTKSPDVRDLPEWQEARRAYLAEGSDDMDPDAVYIQRVRAAFELRRIEQVFKSQEPR